MPANPHPHPDSESGVPANPLTTGPILIAKADRLYGECLRDALSRLIHEPQIQRVTTLAAAQAALEKHAAYGMLVCGVGFREGDALSWLTKVTAKGLARRILVVTARKEPWLHVALRDLPIHGVFNAFEGGMDALGQALRVVASGGYYLSPSFRELLHRPDDISTQLFRQLTIKEQLVLSVIGDGSDDLEAADRLGMSRAAVRSHRKRLHIKLGINHKGELIRKAVRFGFVRMTSDGIIRPGFENLVQQISAHPFPE